MKISVIVPFWNSEKWLGRCCESLISQEGDFDFILVDDKSTDNSREIAYEYCMRDPRFILMTNHRTKGVSGARNTGLEYAVKEKGWITFLDADDEMLSGAYRGFVGTIKEDERANIHQFNHMRYYAEIDKLTRKYVNIGGVYHVGHLPQCWFGVWNKLYSSEFLQDIRFDETIQYGEDGLFILECLVRDDYIHHAKSGLSIVKHRFDNKQSLSHIKTERDILKQIHAYEEFWERQDDPKVKIATCKEISLLWGVRMVKALS